MAPAMKLTWFFILISFNFVLVPAGKCPRVCMCDADATTIVCSHLNLTVIPVFDRNAISVDLRYNHLSDLPRGVFKKLSKLQSLMLNDNRIPYLRTGAFHGLREVKTLFLYRNMITYIQPYVFADMRRLELLYLQLNNIQEVNADTFAHLPMLSYLYLNNNSIKSVPSNTFNGMRSLKYVRLDNNQLVCSCSTFWLYNMLMNRTNMEVVASCSRPPRLEQIVLNRTIAKQISCSPPEIIKGPEDVIVNIGDDVVFTCSVTGEPEPEIVWLRDTSLIPKHTSRFEILKNGTMIVHNVDATDNGTVSCMATNPSGVKYSKKAKIRVMEPIYARPMFTVTPVDTIGVVNQSVSFDCKAVGYPKPHLSWLFDGERIVRDDRSYIRPNGTLVIEYVDETNVGTYTCRAENINGQIGTSVLLDVIVPPTIANVPENRTASYGETVSITCSGLGRPTPSITWTKNGEPIRDEPNIILSNYNRNITIVDVTDDDEAMYRCRAENVAGSAEVQVYLKVQDGQIIPPHIVVRPVDTDAYKETSVMLPCEVESEPPALIEWRKDGSRIEENDKYSITIIGSIIIRNASLTDAGRYECTVFNEYGRDTASVYLTVKDHVLPGDVYVNIALTQAIRDVDQAIARTVENLFRNKTKVDIHDLYSIARFPNAPAREVARAAEIYERTLDKVKDYVVTGTTITSVEPFTYQNILSNEHLEVISRLSGCVAHRDFNSCSDMCYHAKYRTFDGTCNNFAFPTWGSSLSGFRRLLFPIYENGFSQPVGWNKHKKYNGFALPSARLVSTTIITTNTISEDVTITHMVMQWGQWLDHDLDHALPSVSSQTWDGVDCKKTCDYAPPCFPIEVPENDTRISNRRCIDFIRTSAVCGSGMTSVLFGTLQPREQINQLTSFIDASQVYGFEQSVAQDLRDLTNENGLLRVGATFPGRKPLLPTTGLNAMDCRRNLDESTRSCFVAGDIRANEQIGLAAMHTIWMREHNRVALQLKTLNPFWDGTKVYQEARKVVGAEIQFITYEHWLPIILGSKGYEKLGKYKGYNSKLNPSISNVFATAALRFGHSMINPVLHRYDENFEPIAQGHLLLRNAFFSPWRLVDEGGVDPLLRGMFTTPAKLKTPTENLNSELTEQLFYTAHAVALDLAAINIQRGRDHGLPPYTKWRQFCNMTEVNDFEDLSGEISEKSVIEKLRNLYGSVHNIDVWVGGILEDQVDGGKVGPLFQCLLIEQFARLRDGDRFWYENPSVFTPDQLNQIKETSLARVLCDNGDNIDTIGENVFLLPEVQEGMLSCDDLPTMDFRYWADCESCGDDNEIYRNKRSVRGLGDDTYSADNGQKSLETVRFEEMLEALNKRLDHLEKMVYNGTDLVNHL